MAKLEIKIGKGEGTMTATAAKALMKADVLQTIVEALNAKYGADAAGMLRVFNPENKGGTRPVNVLGVRCADITEDGGIFDGVLKLELTATEWCDRVGTKSTKRAFDWDTFANEYKAWAAEQEQKAADKAADKAKRDAEAAAAKAKREAEKAAKAAEAAKPETDEE